MKNQKVKLYLAFVVLSLLPTLCFSQPPTDTLPGDPGAISISTYQNMHFGSFSQGASGGTILLSNTGVRSSGGTVLLLNIGVGWYHAIFEIEAPENTLLSISTSPGATLTGSSGGTMSLALGSPYPGSPFVSTVPPPGRTQLRIGGTLTVGNSSAAPPGNYTGSFYITINNE
jgi:hypothetical protein